MHATSALRTVALLAGLAAAAASAQTGDGKRPPCLDDAQRLCGQVPQDGEWVHACLQGHLDAVSADCRKHLDTLVTDVANTEADCESDVARLCSDVVSTAGARMSCLLDHRGALSRKCRERLDTESEK